MTYSCSDFTDTILGALGITVPEEHRESPEEQARLALTEIYRLQALDAAVKAIRKGSPVYKTAVLLSELASLRALIAETMEQHIYDAANGEKPGPDCPYSAALARIDELLKLAP